MPAQDSKDKLGKSIKSSMLEAIVLAVLSQGDSYGYEIAASGGIEIAESTVYPVLRRLEGEGHLRSYSQTHDARLRKYYSITETGIKHFYSIKNDWESVKVEIDFALQRNEGD